MDTIYALATASGRAGVSIVRISGPDVAKVSRLLCGELPKPRLAMFGGIKGESGEILDHGLILYFPTPASFTGEDVLELHLHGSIAIVNAVTHFLSQIPNCRLAEPGEFSRRALMNGKMDIVQAEGLADLIEAETEAQRKQALALSSGNLSSFVADLRTDLIRAAALLAAVIDFADEEIPDSVSRETSELISHVINELQNQLAGFRYAERIRHGFEVAIIGPPNVGKSTLLNALAKRDAAITSEIAGTTRDVIEVQMDLGGLPVTLLDTAGLRETDDLIEKEGVKRAIARATDADLRVVLTDGEHSPLWQADKDDIVVRAKVDLADDSGFGISGLTGQGVDKLVDMISTRLEKGTQKAGLVSRERHRQAFSDAVTFLESAECNIQAGEEMFDLASEDIRSSMNRLDFVVGRVDVESLLDVVFSSFCLGK